MSFLACLNNEFQQGLVNQGLYKQFMDRWNSPARGGPSVPDPQARAYQIIEDMKVAAEEDRRRALLQWQATRRLTEAMREYTNRKGQSDVGEFAMELLYSVRSGDSSIEGRSEALFADYQSDLAQFFNRFRRRDVSGTLRNKAGLQDVIRELDGQTTNNADARAYSLAVQQVFEKARRQFNAAGGNIPKVDRWIMPQVHNPAKVGKAGFDTWRDFIINKLDVARMIDSRTGQPIDPADLDGALREAYKNIAMRGTGEHEAQLRGGGSGILALQRLDHRFLVFRNADDWMAYQKEFGSGTLIDVMFNHLRSMSKDIAAMQELGPDPHSTIRWLRQTIDRQAERAQVGDPDAIFPLENGRGKPFEKMDNPAQGRQDYAKAKIDALQGLWDVYTGATYTEGSMGLANAIGTAKNVFLSNALGSTTFIAQTDHAVAAVARGFAGLPWWRGFTDYVRAATPGGRQEALELGIVSESALNTFMTEMRYMGPVFGKTWSRWLVERSMTASLLKPHTAAMKNAWGLTFFRHLAKEAGKPWRELDPQFREYFARYGLSEGDWEAIRFTPTSTTQRGLEIIRHRDIANGTGPAPAVQPRAGMTAREELALRLLEMIRSETEAAVPSGNLRTQRLTSSAPGTVRGALWASIASLKSYGLSTQTIHMYRVYELIRSGRLSPAAAYLTMLIMGGTGLAFLAMQGQEKLSGRDFRDIDDLDAWKEAGIKGAALGIFAEPLVYGENAEGRDVAYELLGPLADQLGQAYSTGASAISETTSWVTGEEVQTGVGNDLTRLMKKITPFSTTWYLRLANDRYIWDNLHRMTDAEAEEAMARRFDWYLENKEQGWWWGPGETSPDTEALGD